MLSLKRSRVIIYCTLIAIVAAGIIVAIILFASQSKAPTDSIQGTFSGEIVCLPHKGDGPQTLECAFGLQADDGRFYKVQSDPGPLNAEVGDRVKIKGLLEPGSDDRYDTSGTLYGDVEQ